MRARLVACVLLLTGAVTGGAPCLAWPGEAMTHTCCTPVHCHEAMSTPMASPESTTLPITAVVATLPATAAAGRTRGIPRCCTTDRDDAQPQSPKSLATGADWSADLHSARVPLHAAPTSVPSPLRDPVPLAPASTARHVLLSVFLV
jgi:hypothetical protein